MPKDGPIVQEKPIRRPGARRQAALSLFALFALIAAAVGAYLFLKPRQDTYTLRSYDTARVARGDLVDSLPIAGVVRTRIEQQVISPQPGTLTQLLVAPGDLVKRGDLVAVVSPDGLEDALAEAEGILAAKRYEREKLLTEKRLQDEARAREAARLAAARDRAAAELDKKRRLFEAGGCTKDQLNAAEEALAKAEDEIAEAQSQAAAAEARFALNLRDADLQLQIWTDKVAAVRRKLEACRLRSPLDGQVIEVFADAGSHLDLHAGILAIADLGRPYVSLDVPEDKVESVAPGQRAEITIGGRIYRGEVSRVGVKAEGGSETTASTVAVEVVFHEQPERVVPGGSATVEIIRGVKRNALYLPRGQYLTTGNQLYVYRIEGDRAHKVEVQFGLLDATTVEVLSGLAEGDEIIISGYQDFIGYDQIQLVKKGGTRS